MNKIKRMIRRAQNNPLSKWNTFLNFMNKSNRKFKKFKESQLIRDKKFAAQVKKVVKENSVKIKSQYKKRKADLVKYIAIKKDERIKLAEIRAKERIEKEKIQSKIREEKAKTDAIARAEKEKAMEKARIEKQKADEIARKQKEKLEAQAQIEKKKQEEKQSIEQEQKRVQQLKKAIEDEKLNRIKQEQLEQQRKEKEQQKQIKQQEQEKAEQQRKQQQEEQEKQRKIQQAEQEKQRKIKQEEQEKQEEQRKQQQAEQEKQRQIKQQEQEKQKKIQQAEQEKQKQIKQQELEEKRKQKQVKQQKRQEQKLIKKQQLEEKRKQHAIAQQIVAEMQSEQEQPIIKEFIEGKLGKMLEKLKQVYTKVIKYIRKKIRSRRVLALDTAMPKEITVEYLPKSYVSESFRTLRTNIQFMNANRNVKSILITSTMPGEGKSYVSSNLAATFAQANKKVVIVDADMRKGRLHEVFKVVKQPGLSNYLSGVANGGNPEDLTNYIRETILDNLYILPMGNTPPNPSELISSERMQRLIKKLTENFDVVIFDGTPSKIVTDSVILSREVDTTLIVTGHNKTKMDDLKKVQKDIENVGGKIAGVVINNIPINTKKYSSSYYYENEEGTRKKVKKMYSL